MLDHLLVLYREVVTRFVLVVHPAFEPAVRQHCEAVAPGLDVAYARQPEPTGMLDAILLAGAALRGQHQRIWITWCDQVGVHPRTIASLRRLSGEQPEAQLILPTARQENPYIHLERDAEGRVIDIRQRREGDVMPPAGESDIGLFSLSPDAFFNWLPRFASEATNAAATRERNFLPFVPWLVHHGQRVMTFACTNELEAIGVNTPDDRRRLEQYLLERDGA
jgi:bifunctional N-acetylglucosamine-1-phosphate-uridyltransferase/glucosamine-1-phosphate-acetyltransferase GlmU-like protein